MARRRQGSDRLSTNTVTDTGSDKANILPAAVKGTGPFTSNILSSGNRLDLKPSLAATNWNGAACALSNYLAVADSALVATLSIAPTSGGVGMAMATISGSSTNLAGLLAHVLTNLLALLEAAAAAPPCVGS